MGGERGVVGQCKFSTAFLVSAPTGEHCIWCDQPIYNQRVSSTNRPRLTTGRREHPTIADWSNYPFTRRWRASRSNHRLPLGPIQWGGGQATDFLANSMVANRRLL